MRSLIIELHDDLSWVSVCDGLCTDGFMCWCIGVVGWRRQGNLS
jgi:hypothetical protein